MICEPASITVCGKNKKNIKITPVAVIVEAFILAYLRSRCGMIWDKSGSSARSERCSV